MTDSDSASSDHDLIQEILALRPDEYNQELRHEAAPEVDADVLPDDDPFAAPPNSAPIVPKKRNRRLQDSDDDEDCKYEPKSCRARITDLSDDEGDDERRPSQHEGDVQRQSKLEILKAEHGVPIINAEDISDDSSEAVENITTLEKDSQQSSAQLHFKKKRLGVKSDNFADKRRRTIISDGSADDDNGNEQKGPQSAQDRNSVRRELPVKMGSVRKSSKPPTEIHDDDESDIDEAILKKHCSSTERRQKYASKTNPEFLHKLLQSIQERSTILRLGLSTFKQCDSDNTAAVVLQDKSDDDSIELEFSDEEECVIYDQHFQRRSNVKSGGVPAKTGPPGVLSTNTSQKLQVRTQSVCGLYQNVGGQSSRQTMVKGLKKESRIRRMTSLSTNTHHTV